MWIYAKDDEKNIWKIDYNIVKYDMEKTLTENSPIKRIRSTEDDVLDWAMDNSHAFEDWILMEQAEPHKPVHLIFAMVIMREAEAMPVTGYS